MPKVPPIHTKWELWRRGNLYWKLHAGQKQVHGKLRVTPQGVREVVLLMSRRWGKSYLGVVMAMEDCLLGSGRQVFIVGPNLKQTRRIITPLLQEIAADAPPGLIKQTKSELTWTIGGSTLIIGAFDTALESFRGLRADAIYLEESGLTDMNDYEYILKSVLRPTLMHSRGRMYHLTTPPREENHPFVFNTIPEAVLKKAIHTFTIEDNPLLSKADIAAEIEAAGGRTSPHCRRELFCEIVRDEQRLITPEFSEEKHVKTLQLPEYTHFVVSIDFGGVKDNHALLLGYYDFTRNKVCFCDEEWLPINTSTDDIIKAGLAMEKRNRVRWVRNVPRRVVDAPDQLLLDINKAGYACFKPAKGKDSVEDGIQAMRVALLKERMEFDPKCAVTIQTFKYGMWDKHRKDFMRTDALGHCDAMAAASYAFRHIDKFSNPIPPTYYNPNTHHTEPQKGTGLEDTLNGAFYD